MTNIELQKLLAEYPEDMLVTVNGYEDGCNSIKKVFLENVLLNDNNTMSFNGEHTLCFVKNNETSEVLLIGSKDNPNIK